jgi:hypothetical protein
MSTEIAANRCGQPRRFGPVGEHDGSEVREGCGGNTAGTNAGTASDALRAARFQVNTCCDDKVMATHDSQDDGTGNERLFHNPRPLVRRPASAAHRAIHHLK